MFITLKNELFWVFQNRGEQENDKHDGLKEEKGIENINLHFIRVAFYLNVI
jgi:hypothetical protein